MTQEPVDLKLLSEVKHYFSDANTEASDNHCQRNVGAFKYFAFPMPPEHSYNEVYPGILLGDNKCVKMVETLEQIGVTHVVNASMGSKFNQTDTNSDFYQRPENSYKIAFHGIPALDVITFKILPYLRPAADFINEALKAKGKVYVHCQQGISRSATVVIAFLMIHREMDLLSAAKQVRSKRRIYPNDGFVKQLCMLQKELNTENPSGS